jgi:uncharacterized protein involved in exopolysaccharide biosynthesis
MEEEINIIDYINVLIKRWYVILLITIVAALYMGMPNISRKDLYEANASMLFKESGSVAQSPLAGLLGIKSIPGGGGDAFPIIILSRSVAERVLDDMELKKRIKGWDNPKIEKQELISSVQSMPKYSNEKGLFEIKVTTVDPDLSADIANAFAKAGAEFWNKMNYTEARKKREYIESQLPRVERDLKKAETSLKNFSLISPSVSDLQSVEFKRLERDYKIQEESYTLLRREYEAVKLDESKELQPFTMIDPAEKPLKPIKPKIMLNFVIGTVMGLFGGIFLAFGLEYWSGNIRSKK